MANTNEYMNTYMKKRWRERKERGEKLLGGKCVKCSSIENLEFDHIDPSTKSFTIGNRTSCSEKLFLEELAKCQLLCSTCHGEKSLEDSGAISAKTSHGTLSSYRYCKCEVCREAKNKYQREKKRDKKVQRVNNSIG